MKADWRSRSDWYYCLLSHLLYKRNKRINCGCLVLACLLLRWGKTESDTVFFATVTPRVIPLGKKPEEKKEKEEKIKRAVRHPQKLLS